MNNEQTSNYLGRRVLTCTRLIHHAKYKSSEIQSKKYENLKLIMFNKEKNNCASNFEKSNIKLLPSLSNSKKKTINENKNHPKQKKLILLENNTKLFHEKNKLSFMFIPLIKYKESGINTDLKNIVTSHQNSKRNKSSFVTRNITEYDIRKNDINDMKYKNILRNIKQRINVKNNTIQNLFNENAKQRSNNFYILKEIKAKFYSKNRHNKNKDIK